MAIIIHMFIVIFDFIVYYFHDSKIEHYHLFIKLETLMCTLKQIYFCGQ